MNNEMLNKMQDMGADIDVTVERLGGDENQYLHYLAQLKDNENIIRLR